MTRWHILHRVEVEWVWNKKFLMSRVENFFRVYKPRSWNSPIWTINNKLQDYRTFFHNLSFTFIIWCLSCKKIHLSEVNKWINISFHIKYFPIFQTSLISMQTHFSWNYGLFWDRVGEPFYLLSWNEFWGLVIHWRFLHQEEAYDPQIWHHPEDSRRQAFHCSLRHPRGGSDGGRVQYSHAIPYNCLLTVHTLLQQDTPTQV